MQIELSSLLGKKGRFAHVYAPDELNLEDERVKLAAPPKVSGQITRNEHKVVVEAQLNAVVSVECDGGKAAHARGLYRPAIKF